MKVLIDEGLSTLQQLGGIGYFSICLWKHLKEFVECDITNYRLLKTLPRGVKRAVYLGLTNLEPLRQKYDIIHYLNYCIPRFLGRSKGVTTIHDLGGLKSPELFPIWYNAYFRRIIHSSVVRSDAFTVSSYAVKQELLSLFPRLDELRVHVCHHGVRSVYLAPQPHETEFIQMNLKPYSYFLFIGNLEKRKNVQFLLTQFISARKSSLVARDTKLVLVGKLGIGYQDFQQLISERENIIHLGRLGDESVVTLYKYCKAFLFPSLYEGFGVPILEAMSQKVPILISNIPSSLELHLRHNSQCFVFELGRDETFVEMLSHLDKNSADISPRLEYGDLSIYSYHNVAREHAKVYAQVLQQ